MINDVEYIKYSTEGEKSGNRRKQAVKGPDAIR